MVQWGCQVMSNKKLNNRAEFGRWTQCVTAMPDPDERVLCLLDDGEVRILRLMQFSGVNFWSDMEAPNIDAMCVTHWMPLPSRELPCQ